MDDVEARELVGRVEGCLGALEALPDPTARAKADDAVAALLDLYGEALGRIVAAASARDGDGALAAELAGDELVSHVLLLHGLHPVPLEERVRGALEEVRPYLSSHGGNVELRGVEGDVVRVALEGSCSGCPSSTVTLKLAIEDAIHQAAPEIERVEAEGLAAPAAGGGNGQLIQLEVPAAVPKAEPADEGPADAGWAVAGAMPELRGERMVAKRVGGEEVLFLRLADDTYAYRPGCPGCEASLAKGTVEATALVCAECGNRYDVLRAGRCLDAPRLHLEPVPLLTDDAGLVRVALGAAA
jgi:Fe-S cluster biogenesis protein NfuA/nitrite reductase/ring-hydroxylating ferredoxin subunit